MAAQEKDKGDLSDFSDDDDYDYSDDEKPTSYGPSSFLTSDPIGGVRKAVDHIRKEVADRSHGMKETIKPLLGKVFHAVSNSGALYRYRIGLDGRLTLEKRLKGSFINIDKIYETKGKIFEAGKAVPIRARRRWRAAVTGDPDKRIRDHLKETPQVKMIDKVSFTLGVILICFAEFLLLRHPFYFPIFYYCLMPILFAYRYYEYSAIKSELYMIDFCYFVNLSVILQTAFDPDNLIWFQANYVLSLGPICFAIVIWRNSLVFHSLDKLTSFFLHSFPTMICHIYRWKLVENNLAFTDEYIGAYAHFVVPILMYATWQLGYLFITEYILHDVLKADPEMITSQRHLARDEKNSMNQLTTKICLRLGYLKKGETFHPDSTLAKVVFLLAQLGYTLATISHTAFLYKTYYWSCIYITFIFITGVWNGASYYIEVFSKRYNLKFEACPPESGSASTEAAESDGFSSANEADIDDDNELEALDNIDLNNEEYSSLIEQLAQQEDFTGDKENEGSEVLVGK